MNNSISRASKEAASKEKASKEAASKEKALKEAALKERASKEAASKKKASKKAASTEFASKAPVMQEFASGGGGWAGWASVCYYSHPLFDVIIRFRGPQRVPPLPRSFLLLFGRFCKGKFEGAGRAGFLKIGGSRPTPPVACRNQTIHFTINNVFK